MEIRTDLALEVKESFPKDNVEISGVILDKRKTSDGVSVSIVDIINKNGEEAMKKPKGRYVTIEISEPDNEDSLLELKKQLIKYINGMCKGKKKILIAGLGNREATPDSLGPKVSDRLFVTSHLISEGYLKDTGIVPVCAVEPGVMAKTGIETAKILKGIINEVKPDVLIAIDALASRSMSRLTKTIQITDTGICPGAGIGNNRQELSKKTLGIDVVAIGVPTVVEAFTIVRDYLCSFFNDTDSEINSIEDFLNTIKNESNVGNFYVTPKSIDEDVDRISMVIADAINESFSI